MAKKKSKVAKLKQKKAKSLTKKRKLISSKYNTPLMSMNPSKSKNMNMNKNKSGNGSSNGGDNKMMVTTPYNSPTNTNRGMLDIKRRTKKPNNNKHNKQEQQDFIKEYQSLQERTLQEQYKMKQSKLNNKNTNNNSGPASLFNNMAKPIFDINQKPTTDELILKTTNQLHDQQLIGQDNISMNGNGNMNTNTMNSQNNGTLLQQMAAKKRHEMQMKSLYTVNNDNDWNVNGNDKKLEKNSYWALQDDDSDDETNNKNTNSAGGGLFSFAAPSFVVPSVTNIDGEDDPDL